MYELYVHGGANIERSKDTFPTEEAAMKEAEMRSTDDTIGWEEKGDEKMLVDYNNSDAQEDIVIMKVRKL